MKKAAFFLAMSLMAVCPKAELAQEASASAQSAASQGLTDFSLQLLKELDQKENTMISPLSIASALSMTANGAGGNTLTQMETVLESDCDSLNRFFSDYPQKESENEQVKVSLANSIWLRENEEQDIKPEFLQKNKEYYDAEIREAPFDESTKDEINNWVKEKTDGQIEKLLEEAPSANAVMYLLNALSFEAKWADPYEQDQVQKGEFTTADGEKQRVDFLHSEENEYISLPDAQGVIKSYAGYRYSFAALLPDEGISAEDLLRELDGEKLLDAINSSTWQTVITAIPKFEFTYDSVLNESLKKLGMQEAFNQQYADFTNMADCAKNGGFYIDKVIHKTKITVDEGGTKAGAVTSVEMECKSVFIEPEEPKEVILNRPFVFLIMDQDQQLPLFIGILKEVPQA